ncbi:MAG: hypothetical protein AW10_03760 [Candidatus Accumulibacter appositus]|uniref:Uncharacterized protein n=1 Tax=Candidatus Accumulibacter appositus TaxID=1454003 RepID=A0A011NQI4_9PROT|nr:MAG: hypothetical protein AW10_03760 [Candidatus Accumulibacter appositus]
MLPGEGPGGEAQAAVRDVDGRREHRLLADAKGIQTHFAVVAQGEHAAISQLNAHARIGSGDELVLVGQDRSRHQRVPDTLALDPRRHLQRIDDGVGLFRAGGRQRQQDAGQQTAAKKGLHAMPVHGQLQ